MMNAGKNERKVTSKEELGMTKYYQNYWVLFHFELCRDQTSIRYVNKCNPRGLTIKLFYKVVE